MFSADQTRYTRWSTGTSYELLESIDLPTGQSYTFEYEDAWMMPGATTGRLKKVHLPTGGFYQYTYYDEEREEYPSAVVCEDGTYSWLDRRISEDGVAVAAHWNYVREDISSNEWQTIVTAPDLPYAYLAGKQTEHIFLNRRETERRVYPGTVMPGTELAEVLTTYLNGFPNTTTTVLDDGSTSKTTTTYTNKLLTAVTEYGWGAGVAGPAIRTTQYQYVHIGQADHVSKIIVRDGGPSGSKESATKFEYDTNELEGCPPAEEDVVQHDDVTYHCGPLSQQPARHNLTRVLRYVDAEAESDPMAATIADSFYYDSLGNRRRATLDCCNQRAWNYSSNNQWAYPDSVDTGPNDELTTTYSYNAPTGLVAGVTDPNGKQSTYTYDNLKRPATITTPDGQQTRFAYDDANRTVTSDDPVEGEAKRKQAKTFFDGLGRAFKTQILNKDSQLVYTASEISYDSRGRANLQLLPTRVETRFDALGRPTRVIPGDATPLIGGTFIQYDGQRTRITTTGTFQDSFNDALGRLSAVDEGSGQTTYTYL